MHWRYWITVSVSIIGSVFVLAVIGFVLGVISTTCFYRIAIARKLKSEENKLRCIHEYETIDLETDHITTLNTVNQKDTTKNINFRTKPTKDAGRSCDVVKENEEETLIYAEARSTTVPRYLPPRSKKKKFNRPLQKIKLEETTLTRKD